MKLSEYIEQDTATRKTHLDVDAPCKGITKIKPERLLSALGVENDVSHWLRARITIGYTCEGCANPAHAYICRPDEKRADTKARIEKLLAPYKTSNMSNLAIAKATNLSPATIARYRKASGIDTKTWVGQDGKTYTTDAETRATRKIVGYLSEISEMLTPQRATPEVRALIEKLQATATEKKQ
jgi:hypothetical protein